MRVQGTLVEVKHNKDEFTNDRGERVPYENVVVRIFDGREVVIVKAKRDAIAPAMGLVGREGHPVAVEVDSPRSVDTMSLVVVQDNPKG